ncbi:MAG: 5-bromo-4-chloroindolyl phosphate hydrolysis family protein, partial [Pseudomonadota bacterium]
MAERYGGKYSPQGDGKKPEWSDPEREAARPTRAAPPPSANPFRNRRATRVSVRATLLFLVPLPLLLGGIGELMEGDAVGMVVEFGALALLLLAAWLTRDGLKAEAEYDQRSVAKPPAMPRKIIGAGVMASGVALAAWLGWGQGLLTALIFGVGAAAAHLAAFGLDPLRAKGVEGSSDFDTKRVAEAIDRAEGLLREMQEAATGFSDRRLEARVDALATAAREVFRTVEEDPRDLGRARKFLGVYLTGARDATVKFADLYARTRDAEARADYEALITDLEA